MGLISRVSSRTYRYVVNHARKFPAELPHNHKIMVFISTGGHGNLKIQPNQRFRATRLLAYTQSVLVYKWIIFLFMIVAYGGDVEHYVFQRRKGTLLGYFGFCIAGAKVAHFYFGLAQFTFYGDVLVLCMVAIFGKRWPSAPKQIVFPAFSVKAKYLIFIYGVADALLYGQYYSAALAFALANIYYHTIYQYIN